MTKTGSIIGDRIDYNEAGALRSQRHIPNKNYPRNPPPPPPRLLMSAIKGSQSKDAFQQHTSTGGGTLSYLTCNNTTTFVLLSAFSLTRAIWPKHWAKSCISLPQEWKHSTSGWQKATNWLISINQLHLNTVNGSGSWFSVVPSDNYKVWKLRLVIN